MSKCTATSKRTGERCNAQAVTGRNVCYHHGGKTPRGVASPHFKTGRWSKDLPTRLSALYEETQSDDTLLSLRDDIRLIDALILSKFDKLESGESGEAWGLMRKGIDALHVALDKEDYAGLNKAMREMRDVVDMRVAHYATEGEIRSQLEQRRKLIETEQKLTLQSEQAITVEKAMLMIGALAGILKAHIHDATTLSAIQADIRAILVAETG